MKKMRDIVNDFNVWSITSPPHKGLGNGQVIWTDNTGPTPANAHRYWDDLATTIASKEFQDMVARNKDTAWENPDKLHKALEIFQIDEITKISALKRKAQEARTNFLHKVSNAMVNHKWTDKVVMAGGCFTSWYHNEPLKDIDVFILDSTYIADALFQCVQQDPDRFKVGNSSYMTNAKVSYTAFDTSTRIQYIVSEYKTREELLDHFDLEHDCISFAENKLYITREAFDAMRTKTLKNHKGNKPADWRINKFLIDRGFRVG
jgi:hypothetical protein